MSAIGVCPQLLQTHKPIECSTCALARCVHSRLPTGNASGVHRRPLLYQCVQSRRAPRTRTQLVSVQSLANSLQDTQLEPVQTETGERTAFPGSAGVYAVYDREQKLQYIGLSRKVLFWAFSFGPGVLAAAELTKDWYLAGRSQHSKPCARLT